MGWPGWPWPWGLRAWRRGCSPSAGWSGGTVEGRAPDGEPLGLFRGRPQPVTADDGVELWAEIDDPRPGAEFADLTVVFSHGYSLNLDSFHFQRRGWAAARAWSSGTNAGTAAAGAAPADRYTIAQLGLDLGGGASTRWRPTGRSCWSATRWAA